MALSFLNKRAQNEEMSFIDHLEELRWHIVRSLLAVIVAAIFIFMKMDWFFDTIILGPIRKDFVSYISLCKFSHWVGIGDSLCMPPVNVPLQATTFGSQFISSITIAFVGGFIIAFPYIFWEVWRFIKPALTPRELKNTRGSILFVSLFFFYRCGFRVFFTRSIYFQFPG